MKVQAVNPSSQNINRSHSQNHTSHITEVSSNIRESHNAFVSFVKGMIERVVSSIKGIWKSLSSLIHHKQAAKDDKKSSETNKVPTKKIEPQETKDPMMKEADPVPDTQEPQLQKPVVDKTRSIKKWSHMEPVASQETEVRHTVEGLKTPPIQTPSSLSGTKKKKNIPLTEDQKAKLKKAASQFKAKCSQTTKTKKTKKPWGKLDEAGKNHRIVSRFLARLKSDDAAMKLGIFRESGTYEDVKELYDKIKNGKRIPKNTEPDVVAEAFKEYIKVNYRIFDSKELVEVHESSDKVKAWQDLIASIDPEKQEQLKRIFRFFAKKIVPNAENNGVTAENFGKTPGECFIIQEEYDISKSYTADELKMLAKAKYQPQQALTFLIKNYDQIFIKKAC